MWCSACVLAAKDRPLQETDKSANVCRRAKVFSEQKQEEISILQTKLRRNDCRLTVAVWVGNRTSSALLVDRHGVAVTLPDVVVASCLLERQSEVRDLVLVPEGDLACVSPDFVDQDANTGLSRGGERNTHCEAGRVLHGAFGYRVDECIGKDECVPCVGCECS